jgi:Beta-lactamase class C and other penicillin binding proteins
MFRYNLLLLLVVFLVSCQNHTDSSSDDAPVIVKDNVKTRIDSTLAAMVDSGRVAGVSALIFERGKEVYFGAFGKADIENNVPMDRNTVVRIYSMTKPVTGVALMQQYEQGKFQLDDPLAKYAPEYEGVKVYAGKDAKGKMILEEPRRPITIRDLTRHTAGFTNGDQPDLLEMAKAANPGSMENTLSEMSQKLASLPLAFHPGEEWSYGICVDVQAYLVEKLSGVPFDEYLSKNIFTPLGMTNTTYTPADLSKLAALYQRDDQGKLNRVPDENANEFHSKSWPMKPGGWGLTSTIDDYMKFARMLVDEGKFNGNTLLKEETVKLMATNHLADSITKRMWLPSKGRVGFGIDFAVRTQEAQTPNENVGTVGEFFWDGAASTLFWVDPVNELTAVLFVQIFPFDRELHKRFRDAIYGPYTGPAPVATN